MISHTPTIITIRILIVVSLICHLICAIFYLKHFIYQYSFYSSIAETISYSFSSSCCFRLNREINGGAWCPSQQISPDTYEWLEINLRGYHIVRGIATQGRFGNGQGREYAEEYMIEYWRAGINKWVRYTNRSGKHVSIGRYWLCVGLLNSIGCSRNPLWYYPYKLG